MCWAAVEGGSFGACRVIICPFIGQHDAESTRGCTDSTSWLAYATHTSGFLKERAVAEAAAAPSTEQSVSRYKRDVARSWPNSCVHHGTWCTTCVNSRPANMKPR
jgi:hypothetical protein